MIWSRLAGLVVKLHEVVGETLGGLARSNPIFPIDPDTAWLFSLGRVLNVKLHHINHILVDSERLLRQPMWVKEQAVEQAIRETPEPTPPPPPPNERVIAGTPNPKPRPIGSVSDVDATIKDVQNTAIVIAKGALPAIVNPVPGNVVILRESTSPTVNRLSSGLPLPARKVHEVKEAPTRIAESTAKALSEVNRVVEAINVGTDVGMREVTVTVEVPNPEVVRRELGMDIRVEPTPQPPRVTPLEELTRVRMPRVLRPKLVREVPPREVPTMRVKVAIPLSEEVRREVNRAHRVNVEEVAKAVAKLVREATRGNPVRLEHIHRYRTVIVELGRKVEEGYRVSRTPTPHRHPIYVVWTIYGPEYICPICGSIFYDLRSLEEHIRIYHRGTELVTP